MKSRKSRVSVGIIFATILILSFGGYVWNKNRTIKLKVLNRLVKKASSNNPNIAIAYKMPVRAAFYEPSDSNSFLSLKENKSKINMLLTECMFIDPVADTIFLNKNFYGAEFIRNSGIKTLAMLANIYGDRFNGNTLHRILNHPAKRDRFINDIVRIVRANHFNGVNIDFEEINEKSDEPLINFARALYNKMHPLGLMVTMDVAPFNEDYNVKELGKYNDHLFLMAYDQHNDSSKPGPISSIPWIKKVISDEVKHQSPDKFILCIAGYGYDWPERGKGKTISYEDARALCMKKKVKVDFDKVTFNLNFSYKDHHRTIHQVYFTSAVTNKETIKIAHSSGMAGVALWRLGMEDQAIWNY
jgi:spore germination protein YaaH